MKSIIKDKNIQAFIAIVVILFIAASLQDGFFK